MSLRIFEQRYIRMVKDACRQQAGFVICMLNAQGNKERNQHIYPLGTYCRVIDFEPRAEGLLGITVAGDYCVSISDIATENDGLRVALCRQTSPWQQQSMQVEETMHRRLKELFAHYPEINRLYAEPRFDDPLWVVYRWLELLPVNAEQKQQLLQQQDCTNAMSFVRQLVK